MLISDNWLNTGIFGQCFVCVLRRLFVMLFDKSCQLNNRSISLQPRNYLILDENSQCLCFNFTHISMFTLESIVAGYNDPFVFGLLAVAVFFFRCASRLYLDENVDGQSAHLSFLTNLLCKFEFSHEFSSVASN